MRHNLIRVVAALVVVAVLAPLGALEVDRKELEGASAKIEFINYEGPETVVNTAEEISGIGTALGSTLLRDGKAGSSDRYYVIHAVDPADKAGLDADILVLGPSVGVNHIRNLRSIIASYLTVAYGYSARDARTLAEFITVYNAVYRGKLDVFKTRYKKVVLGYLTADKVGLSVRYDEWPGKAQIVVPLSDPRLAGTISSIDTKALSDDEVVGKMQEDPSKGIDTRKDMVDIKERETDAAQKRAETAQKDAVKAEDSAAKKQAELAQQKKEATEAQKKADAAKKEAEAKPGDAAAQKKAAETQKAADQKKEDVAKKEDEVAQTQQAAEQKKEEAKVEQEFADTKQQEARDDRAKIADDQQKVIAEEEKKAKDAADAALAAAMPATALKTLDDKGYLSELVLVNLADGKTMKTSPVNTIRGRAVHDTGSGLIAIAGKNGGGGTVTLVLIDPTTLEVTKQGADKVAEYSVLVKNANDYYAVIEAAGGKFVVARFDKTLEAKARSAVNVSPATAIMVTDKGLLVQDDKGRIRLLRATDLVDQTKE